MILAASTKRDRVTETKRMLARPLGRGAAGSWEYAVQWIVLVFRDKGQRRGTGQKEHTQREREKCTRSGPKHTELAREGPSGRGTHPRGGER